MIVVDASVLANAVGDDEAAGQLARARLAAASAVSAPDLVDVERSSFFGDDGWPAISPTSDSGALSTISWPCRSRDSRSGQ